MSRIAILGAGAWGTALALSLARRGGHELVLWSHSVPLAEQLNDVGENLPYLPGFTLPADIFVTSDLPRAIFEADILLCVTPSQHLRGVIAHIAPLLTRNQIVVSASKGIEEHTFLRMSQVIAAVTGNAVAPQRVSVSSLRRAKMGGTLGSRLSTLLKVGENYSGVSRSIHLSSLTQMDCLPTGQRWQLPQEAKLRFTFVFCRF